MTRITETELFPLLEVLRDLRAEDAEEIFATRGPLDPMDFARQIVDTHMRLGVSYTAWHGDFPAAVWGAFSLTPAALCVWAFGTPNWRHVVRPVTRHIRQIMIPNLLQVGFHYAECRSLASRRDSHKWLTALGFQHKAVLSGFGVRREDFYLFAWSPFDDPTDTTAPISENSHSAPVRYH